MSRSLNYCHRYPVPLGRGLVHFRETLIKGNQDLYAEFDWGDYCLMLYYASKIDSEKVKTLLRLIFGEGTYEYTYELPVSNPGADAQFISIQYGLSSIVVTKNLSP